MLSGEDEELAALEAHLGMLLHQKNHWLAERRQLERAARAAAAGDAGARAGDSRGGDGGRDAAAALVADASVRLRMAELEAHMRGFADWRAQVAPQVKLCTERVSQLRRTQLVEALAPGLEVASALASAGGCGSGAADPTTTV